MKHTEARLGRVFVFRLEDGEIVHEAIESFARRRRIRAATVLAVGAADRGSKLVVGPARRNQRPVNPMECLLTDVHEVAGVGTIFPDEKGRPVLHMHLAAGRKRSTTTGCIRRGVRVWQVLEVVITELRGAKAIRRLDPFLGFAVLSPG